jgi:hypothetical protein
MNCIIYCIQNQLDYENYKISNGYNGVKDGIEFTYNFKYT